MHHFKIRDKLEESDAFVDFQCKIIDKQLLAQSDQQENQQGLQVDHREGKSIATCMKKGKDFNIKKSLSDWNSKIKVAKKIEDSDVPLTPEEYGKLVR